MARTKPLDSVPILTARRSGRRKLSVRRKILFSAVATLAFFAGLELLLMVLGSAPGTEQRDPFVGFSNAIPLFEQEHDARGQAIMVVRPSKLVWFNQQSFPVVKPPGTRRVFCLGGSTTFGRPYSDPTSFCGWLREFLPTVDSSCQWEVINAGGVSYASYRVAAVMEELSRYDPDLFVVYSVHNEFLEHRTYANMLDRSSTSMTVQAALSKTRTFGLFDRALQKWQGNPVQSESPTNPNQASQDGREWLPAEVNERLNHTVGPLDYTRDAEWEAKVLRHYELNLRRMVAIANKAQAKIVLVAPASNERDCSPFKSENSNLLNDQELDRFDALMQAAQSAAAANNYPEAASLYQAAVAIDAQHAEASYRLGKALWETGRPVEAQSAFMQALNEDVCALRAIDEIDHTLRRVAEEMHIPLVEFGQKLRAQCQSEFAHDSLGNEYFLDHVHPSIQVHQQLALWIIDGLMQAEIIPSRDLSAPQLRAELDEKITAAMGRIDLAAHGVALRNLAKVLHWSGKFEEAAPRASDALELLPSDSESRFVLADCLKNMGETERALAQYDILMYDYPNYTRAYLPYGELLSKQGDYEKAKGYLLLGLLHEPKSGYGYFQLGNLHAQQGEWSFAVDAFEKADEFYPNDETTLRLLREARDHVADAQNVQAGNQ